MDFFKNNLVAGIGIAFAASILAPIVIPVAGRIGRPLTKSLVRGGMTLYERGREAVAVASEAVEDIMAEIRAERAPASTAGAADGDNQATSAPKEGSPTPAPDAAADRPDGPYGGYGASPIGIARAAAAGAAEP